MICLNQILASSTSKSSHSLSLQRIRKLNEGLLRQNGDHNIIYIQTASPPGKKKNLGNAIFYVTNGELKIMIQSAHQGCWMHVHSAGAGGPSPQCSCLVENQLHIARTMQQLLQTLQQIWEDIPLQVLNRHIA